MIDLVVRVFNTPYPKPNAKLLALAIARRAGSEKGFCWASIDTLSRDTGLGRSTIYRLLADLEGHQINGISAPMLRRWRRPPRPDGRRRTDLMALCFPEMVLEPVMPDLSVEEIETGQLTLFDLVEDEGSADEFDDENVPESQSHSGTGVNKQGQSHSGTDPAVESEPVSDQLSGMPILNAGLSRLNPGPKETLEETNKRESGGDAGASGVAEGGASPETVAMPDLESDASLSLEELSGLVWDAGSAVSRDRSDRGKLVKALSESASAWTGASSALLAHALVRSVTEYCGSDAATTQDGRYCVGLHKLPRRESFRQAVRGHIDALAKSLLPTDTLTRPSRESQAMWVRAYKARKLWPKVQGPEPICFGCRCDEDILKAFGFNYAVRKAEALRRLELWHRSGTWRDEYGPRPTSLRCWIPGDILREAVAVAQEAREKDPAPETTEKPPEAASGAEKQSPGLFDEDAAAFD